MPMHYPDPIPISALQHWAYRPRRPRQCGLIHLEQAFDDNLHTLRGNAVHARVDKPGVDTAPTSNPITMGALRAMVPLSQIVARTDYPYRTWKVHVRGLAAIFTPAE